MHPIIQQYLPQQLLSSFVGMLANSNCKLIKNTLIKIFTTLFPVNMSEATVEDPFAYQTFNHFFTRTLKSELRPITSAKNVLVSPCDGTVFELGSISNNSFLQAKGHAYSIQDLLGPNVDGNVFQNGSFINAYLAPIDYHRVHMPITGSLQQMVYIPGKLFSVNNKTANYIPNLFARNERVVAIFNTDFGKVAIVLVGAMLVGSIHTVWAGCINPTHSKLPLSVDYNSTTSTETTLNKGQEMGLFQMGSTVIVLLEQQNIQWEPNIVANQKLLLGQKLATFS